MANRCWPLPKSKIRITSRFAGRINPITGRAENHSGTDFAAPDGTPFHAVADGTVQYIGPASGYGQWIVIDHPAEVGGGCSEYGHMWDAYATGLKVGDKVRKGQVIGYVGSNGQSTGAHLHLTVWERGYGGRRVDPETWLAGADYPGENGTPAEPWAPPEVPGTIFGIDISSWQKDYPLSKVKADGMEFVIIRLCDGTYQDPLFKSHLADAEKQGLLVSCYWYLRAPSEGSTIAQQVDVIDAQLGERRDLGVWIDVESVDKAGRKLLTKDDVWAAKRELESRGYHVPGIYSGAWYWEHMPGGEPSMDGLGYLWVSNYGHNRTGAPKDLYAGDGGDGHRGWRYPLGDRTPDILQFGSEGTVAGWHPVDINAYRGTREELARIFNPTITPQEELTVADIQAILDRIDQKAEEVKRYVDVRITGPIGSDVKDIRQQLTGGRDKVLDQDGRVDLAASYPGWKQLGQNQAGQDLTIVDGVAALRQDMAELTRKIDQIGAK